MNYIFVFLLFSQASLAATTTTLEGTKSLKLPDFSSLAKTPAGSGRVSFSFTCEDEYKNKLKKGDPGYEDCLSKSQAAAAAKSKNDK